MQDDPIFKYPDTHLLQLVPLVQTSHPGATSEHGLQL